MLRLDVIPKSATPERREQVFLELRKRMQHSEFLETLAKEREIFLFVGTPSWRALAYQDALIEFAHENVSHANITRMQEGHHMGVQLCLQPEILFQPERFASALLCYLRTYTHARADLASFFDDLSWRELRKAITRRWKQNRIDAQRRRGHVVLTKGQVAGGEVGEAVMRLAVHKLCMHTGDPRFELVRNTVGRVLRPEEENALQSWHTLRFTNPYNCKFDFQELLTLTEIDGFVRAGTRRFLLDACTSRLAYDQKDRKQRWRNIRHAMKYEHVRIIDVVYGSASGVSHEPQFGSSLVEFPMTGVRTVTEAALRAIEKDGSFEAFRDRLLQLGEPSPPPPLGAPPTPSSTG